MSDRIVIRCPGCEKKLGLKPELMGSQIKCPTCATVLQTRAKTEIAAAPTRKKRRSASSPPPAESANPARRRKSSRSSSGSGSASASSKPKQKQKRTAGDQSSRKRASGSESNTKRKSSKRKADPAPLYDEFESDAGLEDAGGYDDYSDDYGDDYGDEQLVDDDYDANAWGDDEWTDDDGADWNEPAAFPSSGTSRKKNKKKAAVQLTTPKKQRKKKKKGKLVTILTGGGTFTWLAAGLVAGFVSCFIQIGVGYTGIGLLLYLATILSGGLIGGAIRATSGDYEGWGPGLVAVGIAFPAIVLGRIGAMYVAPEMDEFWGDSSLTAEEIDADIERRTTEDGMIASLIEDELSYNDSFLERAGVGEDDEMYSAEYIDAEYEDSGFSFEQMYLPAVWAQARKIWLEAPEDERARKTEERRLDEKLSRGVMDTASLDRLVEIRTTDERMTQKFIYDVRSDDAWRAESGVTEFQLNRHDQHHYGDKTIQERTYPKVWEESERRWNSLDEAEKAARRDEVKTELLASIEFQEEMEDMQGKFRIGHSVIAALISLLLPFSPLICTGSSLMLAFRLGANLAS